MAMFTEKGQGPLDSEAGLSIIGTGMRVVGDITADGVVKIEGTVVGTVRAGRQVLVGKGGEVEGDVISREAIIGGEVRGSIHADERVEQPDGRGEPVEHRQQQRPVQLAAEWQFDDCDLDHVRPG